MKKLCNGCMLWLSIVTANRDSLGLALDSALRGTRDPEDNSVGLMVIQYSQMR